MVVAEGGGVRVRHVRRKTQLLFKQSLRASIAYACMHAVRIVCNEGVCWPAGTRDVRQVPECTLLVTPSGT